MAIAKISNISITSLSTVVGVAKANISKIMGVTYGVISTPPWGDGALIAEDFEDTPTGWTETKYGASTISYTAGPIAGDGTYSASFSDLVGLEGASISKTLSTPQSALHVEFDLYIDRLDSTGYEQGPDCFIVWPSVTPAPLIQVLLNRKATPSTVIEIWTIVNKDGTNWTDKFLTGALDTKYNLKMDWANPGTFEWFVNDVSQGTQAVDVKSSGTSLLASKLDFGCGPFTPTDKATVLLMDNILVTTP